jgi:predicted  nucleic acid-binding Zn-ribbon protein
LTNTLQKKLSQVRSEKADLEKLIEKEHAEHEVMEQKLVTLQEKVDNPEIKEPSSIETAVRKTRFTNSLPGMTEMPDDEGEEVNDEMWDDDLGRPVFR